MNVSGVTGSICVVSAQMISAALASSSLYSYSALAQVLPYLDQGHSYQEFDFSQPLQVGLPWRPAVNSAMAGLERRPLIVLLCPSESGDPIYLDGRGNQWAGCNYRVNGGSGSSTNYCASTNGGLFWRGSKSRLFLPEEKHKS